MNPRSGSTFALMAGIAVVAVAATASNAAAQSSDQAPSPRPIEELKRVYLQCERAAVAGKLDGEDVGLCSVVYEELKWRAFGGDFHRLKAWADLHLKPASQSHTGVRSA